MEQYQVSETTRKLWEIELDIYEKIKAICEKYHLRYYAIGGTLLGAVRHKGFIPWDDDMDLLMPFEDYMVFCRVAQRELQEPYYLASWLTEPEYGGIMGIKVRRTDTLVFTQWEMDNRGCLEDSESKNRGVWVDIFPLCNIPDDDQEKLRYKEAIMEVWKAVRGCNAIQSRRKKLPAARPEYEQYIENFENYHKLLSVGEIKQLYVQRCGMVKGPTRLVGLSSWRTLDPKLVWEREWFDAVTELPFEGIRLPCPAGYEKILETQYGDWRTPVMDGACHQTVLLSTGTGSEKPRSELERQI